MKKSTPLKLKQKQERLGEIRYNNSGDKMTIIEYISATNITIQFENGLKVFKAKYPDFKRGNIANPINKSENRLGKISYNTCDSKMIIIEYINCDNIVVKFDNGYIVKTNYQHFKNGDVRNPYDITVYGIGYLGESDYKTNGNERKTDQYKIWSSMLQRCYDAKALNRDKTYIGCSVCEEWHNFQNFAKWYDKNYYQVNNEMMALDKDILVKGNKIYSPDTCIFVPENINKLFIKSNTIRGDYPIGVSYNDSTGKYVAQCKYGIRKNKYLGLYDTPENAFYFGYKPFKEKHIKKVANEYKGKIPQKLYDAMMNYIVEITD